jgi:ribosomal protein S12 methylthiotransferase accessory factor
MRFFANDLTQHKEHTGGTHRSRSPRATLDAYVPRLPSFGITRLANVTGLDCIGIPVYVAVRPNSRSLAVSQGKGIDAECAKVSALMESIENWHAERIALPLRHESFSALRREASVIDVTALPLRAGVELRLDRPMLWVQGWDLMQERATWVPFEFVSTNTVVTPGATPTFYATTNGLASGNHLLEAIEHGLLELIERDAVALAHLEPESALAARRIDPTTIDDAVARRLLERLAAAEMDVAIWDVTSDLGVPTIMCAIVDAADRPRWRALGVSWGYGAHLAPQVALTRALTEAAQSRLTVITGSRDDNPHHVYAAESDPERLAALRAALFDPPPQRAFGSKATRATESFDKDIQTLLAELRAADVPSVVAVDLTRPEVGIPVAKVIAPGLEMHAHAAKPFLGRRAKRILAGKAS